MRATAVIEDAVLTDEQIIAFGLPVINHNWTPRS